MNSLPATDPLEAAAAWLDEARRSTELRNPLAMALATATPSGLPSLRMVLLKHLDAEQGFAVFYTNYESRKAVQLDANPRAAGVLYWESFGRQLRIEGVASRSPAAESDAYFATRPGGSQLNAWASRQSAELDSADALRRRALEKAAELGARPRSLQADEPLAGMTRPQFWGGYRLWIDRIEFWVEGTKRFHERTQFTRRLVPAGNDRYEAGAWTRRLLQP